MVREKRERRRERDNEQESEQQDQQTDKQLLANTASFKTTAGIMHKTTNNVGSNNPRYKEKRERFHKYYILHLC